MKNRRLVLILTALAIVSGLVLYFDPFYWIHEKSMVNLNAPSFATYSGVLEEVAKANDLKIYGPFSVSKKYFVPFIDPNNETTTIQPGPIGVLVKQIDLKDFDKSFSVWGQNCQISDVFYFYSDGSSLIVPIDLYSDDAELIKECADLYPSSVPGYQVFATLGDGSLPITVVKTDILVLFVFR